MIKQDNRSPLSNETDEKIRRLKELLDASDEQKIPTRNKQMLRNP